MYIKKLIVIISLYPIFFIQLLYSKDVNIIEAEEAIKLIGNKDVIFISGDSEDVYNNNHIINSIEMYAHHLHHSDMGDMHCAPLFMCIKEAEEYIREKGIKNNQLIIAYDNFQGPNATGVYTFFESIGHKNIKLLNGGFSSIQKIDPMQLKYNLLKNKRKKLKREARKQKKQGMMDNYHNLMKEAKDIKKEMLILKKKLLVVEGEEPIHKKSHYTINPEQLNIKYLAEKNEVKKAVDDLLKNKSNSKYIIIDTRSMIEIIGQRKMDNVARGGHIPGAKFIEWRQITDTKNRKSFKSLADLQKIFDKNGITKDKIIYTYCQVGVGRGSHLMFALRLLGYKNVKVFSGSWDVWGNDMNLPLRR